MDIEYILALSYYDDQRCGKREGRRNQLIFLN